MRAVAYLNYGRWVAMCPRPGCLNAEGFGKILGTVGGLTGDMFYCRVEFGGCGLRCPADWPPNVAHIEALVMPRPVPATRNWLPGETLHDLLAENLEHGLVPADALESGPSRRVLAIVNDEITFGQVGFTQRPEIEGGRS